MSKFEYIDGGDVTNPINTGKKALIVHCVNDIFVMGAGVARALFTKWPNVRTEYLKWGRTNPQLGDVQYVDVAKNIVVGNLIGQHNVVKDREGNPPVRYEAVAKGFDNVRKYAVKNNCDVHIPNLACCDLAGGVWVKVEEIIQKALPDTDVYIYDLFHQRKSGKNEMENLSDIWSV